MKVLACIILVVGSAAALRSGPYLPNGWRPDGPAFLLPGEVAKPAATTQEPQESEAAGSDFLREYGPPKVQEVSQDLTQQALPDVVTEQSFAVIDARFNQEEEVKAEAGVTEETTQENFTTEQSSTAIATEPEATTTTEEESVTETEQVIKGKSINFDIDADATLASILEEATTENLAITQDTVAANAASAEKRAQLENAFEAAVKTLKEIVDKEFKGQVQAVEEKSEKEVEAKLAEEVINIAEALVNLKNEIKAQQVETVQEVAEVKSVQESAGALEQVPEGFLEYGPPGFKEYGPPKDELLRSEPIVEAKPVSDAVEKNGTRRRRFSPKFRQTPKRKQ